MDEKKNSEEINKDQPGHNSFEYESDSSTNSDGTEKCPICLLSFENQEVGRPEVCNHSFCYLCIFEWSKVVKTCPIDRKEFTKILAFENLDSDTPSRTVTISEQISLKDFTNGENEYTQCEICRSTDREDVMLLCDGCDKGFHMDCLSPPLLEIPEGNWFCVNCDQTDNETSESEDVSDEEEADVDEIYDLQNEIDQEIGQLPSTRLRNRFQPQIIRTLQSERIRNAILARRSLRSTTQIDNVIPSTSSVVAATRNAVRKPPAPVRKRSLKRRRRRRATKVVEYEIKDGQKFPVKTTRVVRRRKRKLRKIKKARKSNSNRKVCAGSISAGFKHSNSNVFNLQKGRQLAGLNNFNIFEPTYQLDYVPDGDDIDDFETAQSSTGTTLIQSVVNYTNPLRRKALITKRAIENFSITSSNVNLIDSILNEHGPYMNMNNSSRNLSKESAKEKFKSSSNDDQQNESNNCELQQNNEPNTQTTEPSTSQINTCDNETLVTSNTSSSNADDRDNEQFNSNSNIHGNIIEKKLPQKNKKKTTSSFDMFGDSPVNDPSNEQDVEEAADICPNFSIYGSVNQNSDENLSLALQDQIMNEENIDLVQMSDNEHNNSDEIEPAVIRSQPASPDLENDMSEQVANEERSYTPPIVSKDAKSNDESGEKRKRDRDHHHRKHKRRELERYNVRDRLKDKSPRRMRDRFGRNRTRSRSRSHEHDKYSRRKSRSHSRRPNKRKSKTPDKRRRRSYSRSLSRRDSSNERSRHHSKSRKSKHKSSHRRSRSATPPRYRDKSPARRRDRSTSDKSRKKKRRNRSREERVATTHTKEVFTSGQNILVSLNFNNSNNNNNNSNEDNNNDKRSTRSKSDDKNDETIVDITTKKKININSKPVAIIDLARSPFKELTPEYKKESNVIELSDSEGEKNLTTKSPDSTKLYDPFDILNSPSNENVSSSQQNTATTTSTLKALSKNSIDFTNKLGPAIIKNLNIPLIANNSEENLVSSSSSINNIFDKVFQSTSSNSNNNKVEVLQNEIVQLPINTNATTESPYSPGNDYIDDIHDDEMEVNEESKASEKQQTGNIFDELFGSSTPPLSKKNSKKSTDPDKYLTKLKRQERVIEEVKLVIKPYYSKRIINKEQYKEIMRKAVPKICHNKSGEINPTKIKYLIDSYVKFYTHKKKREPEEVF